jgi:dCTP deaminase
VLAVILSDRSIRAEIEAGRIGVDPYDPEMVQPSSIDVRLDHRFLVFRSHTRPVIDVRQDLTDLTEQVTATDTQPFILHPGEFVLGATAEVVALPDDIVGRVEGKSSLGRLGLLIHTTAGFVDAGFRGQLTLEFSNVATLPITLYPGMKIGQISFLRMDGPAEHPYGSSTLGSKYAGQLGPTPSQYWKNFQG